MFDLIDENETSSDKRKNTREKQYNSEKMEQDEQEPSTSVKRKLDTKVIKANYFIISDELYLIKMFLFFSNFKLNKKHKIEPQRKKL